MDRWATAFELHKFPEIGDMKPSEMMRQMKALLPPDSPDGTYFMPAFLLRLPADMIDHIISQDFKDCTKWRNTRTSCTQGGATQSPPSMRTTIQQSTPFRRPSPGELASLPTPPLAVLPGVQPPEDPGPVQRRQGHLILPHHLRRPGEEGQAWVPVGPGKRIGRQEINTKYND